MYPPNLYPVVHHYFMRAVGELVQIGGGKIIRIADMEVLVEL